MPENTEAAAPAANEKTPLEQLQEEIETLKTRVQTLESMAHNTHSIPPETVETIIKQSVQRVGRHLRATGDILNVLES